MNLNTAIWTATLATGLASGILVLPQTFLSLHRFFASLYLLYQLLQHPNANVEKTREAVDRHAYSICLWTYRGVPDLEQAGVCYTQDALYLRGLWKIERAVAEDETVLDPLAVGVVALEQLADLRKLGIVSPPQPLRKLANHPDLDAYILSFAASEKAGS